MSHCPIWYLGIPWDIPPVPHLGHMLGPSRPSRPMVLWDPMGCPTLMSKFVIKILCLYKAVPMSHPEFHEELSHLHILSCRILPRLGGSPRPYLPSPPTPHGSWLGQCWTGVVMVSQDTDPRDDLLVRGIAPTRRLCPNLHRIYILAQSPVIVPICVFSSLCWAD